MKKIFLLLFVFCSLKIIAQKTTKAVFLEIGGIGTVSINYDMRIKKQDGFGFRVGYGRGELAKSITIAGVEIKGTTVQHKFPFQLNYLTYIKNKRYFEAGAGYTFTRYTKTTGSYIGDDKKRLQADYMSFTLGYRLQPKDKGFLFRANLSFIFGRQLALPYFPGVSVGYKF